MWQRQMMYRWAQAPMSLAICGLLLLTGCDELPGAGPRADSFGKAKWEYANTVDKEKGADSLPFVLVDIDRRVIETLASAEDTSYFKGAFTDRSPPATVLLGVGDVLRITIFEAGPGGLFASNATSVSPTGGNYVTLPDQEVDQMGFISIPYAGKDTESGLITVKGKRVADVQNEIQKRLMNKAIEPQIIVTLVKRTSNLYSVIGEVGAAGRFSVEQNGTRVLDALSAAGGPKGNDYNTLITLQRGTHSATVRMSTLLTQSENNIFVQPGDLIAVKKDERYYNVLGAMRSNNRVAFEAENVMVVDAIAKAGGLNDSVAAPRAVVIFRREDVKTLEAMDIKLDGHLGAERVPTVYRFDLTEPAGMFFAQKMALRNDDIVYVSNHPFNDVTKLLGALRDVLLIKLIDD